jgi:hypothetical protein
MHDNWLIAVALSTSGVGMVGLLFAMVFLELPENSIPDAEASPDGAPLRLRGEVISTQQRGNITTISISQPQVIEVVLFDANISLPKDTCVVVQGKRSSYNGKPQLTATRVRRC